MIVYYIIDLRKLEMNKQQYAKWLEKRGLSRKQVSRKKKVLGSPNSIPDYNVDNKYKLSNMIPNNGTKSPDISKAKFSNENYALAPAYNKGAITVVSKNDLKHIGRK
jgi:hypothetical protein